jgi:hypothetical protein
MLADNRRFALTSSYSSLAMLDDERSCAACSESCHQRNLAADPFSKLVRALRAH